MRADLLTYMRISHHNRFIIDVAFAKMVKWHKRPAVRMELFNPSCVTQQMWFHPKPGMEDIYHGREESREKKRTQSREEERYENSKEGGTYNC